MIKGHVNPLFNAREQRWKQYEKLLKESVRENHYHALHKLLQNEHLLDSVEEFKKVHCKPLIRAIADRNVCLIKLMYTHGYVFPTLCLPFRFSAWCIVVLGSFPTDLVVGCK